MSVTRAAAASVMAVAIGIGGIAVAAPAHATGDRPVGVAHIAAWSNIYLHNNGSLTVSTGLKCSPGWQSEEVDTQVNQGDAVGSGTALPDVPCDQAWHTVRFVVSDIGGTFVPGPGSISSQFLVTNVDSGDSAGGHDPGRAVCIRRPHTSHATCPSG